MTITDEGELASLILESDVLGARYRKGDKVYFQDDYRFCPGDLALCENKEGFLMLVEIKDGVNLEQFKFTMKAVMVRPQ